MNSKIRILSLQTDPEDASAIECFLKGSGLEFQFTHVSDRKSFERALDNCNPQVILSDYPGAEFGGKEAITLCRKVVPEAPLIYIADRMNGALVYDSIKIGGAGFFIKNSLEGLPALIRRYGNRSPQAGSQLLAAKRASLLDKLFGAHGTSDGLPDLLWICRPDGRISSLRIPGMQTFQFNVEAYTGKDIRDFLDPEVGEQVGRNLSVIAGGGQAPAHEFQWTSSQGTVEFEVQYTLWSDKLVLVLMHDLTRQKTLERELL
ncbi:MAG: hypothetical protein KGM98_10660, partial [Bacteroidota bacterium]|nr:hypothetical protein [Bacteroidota bacterium]